MSQWFNTYGFAEVADHLLVGAVPGDAGDVRRLSMLGITKVLNLVENDEYARGARKKVESALEDAEIEERRIATVDYGDLDDDFLDEATTTVERWLDEGETVYVHCRAGWQRSAAVAAGVVASRDGLEIDEALAKIQRKKPSADPLPHQRDDLRRWWTTRQAAR
jgi:atypical dual specificity phosphatase